MRSFETGAATAAVLFAGLALEGLSFECATWLPDNMFARSGAVGVAMLSVMFAVGRRFDAANVAVFVSESMSKSLMLQIPSERLKKGVPNHEMNAHSVTQYFGDFNQFRENKKLSDTMLQNMRRELDERDREIRVLAVCLAVCTLVWGFGDLLPDSPSTASGR